MAKVGITWMKLNNQKHHTAKRTGNLSAVAKEALSERKCKDEDYRPDMTCYNQYEGYSSGEELTRAITKKAETYAKEYKEKTGRNMRSDAIIAYAIIVKPEAAFINSLNEEEEADFWDKSNKVIRDIIGEYTIMSRVRHLDEQAHHEHYYGMPFTSDGRLCAKEFFSLKLNERFNREYPERMRALGWDIDDMVQYDTEKAKSDPEYKAKHIEEKKKKHYGESSKSYKLRKENEKLKEQLSQYENAAANKNIEKPIEETLKSSANYKYQVSRTVESTKSYRDRLYEENKKAIEALYGK